ncbi:hypothetical protein EVA_20191 [gut metagenome]|uniref:Uncharacterized protein n=1 Tax=gut metagenome TaxID=749906 RepID=J9FB83_9ZZZZ
MSVWFFHIAVNIGRFSNGRSKITGNKRLPRSPFST